MLRYVIILLSAFSIVAAFALLQTDATVHPPKTELLSKKSITNNDKKHLNKDAESSILIKYSRHYSQYNTHTFKKKDVLLFHTTYIYATEQNVQKDIISIETIPSFLTRLRALLYPKHWFG